MTLQCRSHAIARHAHDAHLGFPCARDSAGFGHPSLATRGLYPRWRPGHDLLPQVPLHPHCRQPRCSAVSPARNLGSLAHTCGSPRSSMCGGTVKIMCPPESVRPGPRRAVGALGPPAFAASSFSGVFGVGLFLFGFLCRASVRLGCLSFLTFSGSAPSSASCRPGASHSSWASPCSPSCVSKFFSSHATARAASPSEASSACSASPPRLSNCDGCSACPPDPRRHPSSAAAGRSRPGSGEAPEPVALAALEPAALRTISRQIDWLESKRLRIVATYIGFYWVHHVIVLALLCCPFPPCLPPDGPDCLLPLASSCLHVRWA